MHCIPTFLQKYAAFLVITLHVFVKGGQKLLN
jgi:hypothetical protein